MHMILQINYKPSLTVNVPILITPDLHHDPSLLIDVKDFMPVVVSSTDKNNIRIHSSFSLANLDRDAGERLRALVDFIRNSQKAFTHAVCNEQELLIQL
jgi:mevalonate kinase